MSYAVVTTETPDPAGALTLPVGYDEAIAVLAAYVLDAATQAGLSATSAGAAAASEVAAALSAAAAAADTPPPVEFTPATASATLVVGKQYSLDATTGTITLTLPASPADGDSIRIIDGATIGAGPTYIVARNGNTIGLVAEDVTLDVVGLDVIFRFKSGNWGLF